MTPDVLGVPRRQVPVDLRSAVLVLPIRSRLMPTGKTRWWYAVPMSDDSWWDSALGSAREAAQHDGAVLRSQTPVWGWVSAQHSRDGKEYPCKDSTAGARRAWIWYGDIG